MKFADRQKYTDNGSNTVLFVTAPVLLLCSPINVFGYLLQTGLTKTHIKFGGIMKVFLATLLLFGSVNFAHAQDENFSSDNTQQQYDESYNATDESMNDSLAPDELFTDRWGTEDLMRPGGGGGPGRGGPGRGRPGRLPPGSYQRSCHSCSVYGNVLTCICRSSRGRSYRTSLYYRQCRRGIENREGRLECL